MDLRERAPQAGIPEETEPAHDRGKPDAGAIVALLNKVLALLKSEAFGLEEIKREVALVEGAVTSPEFGLAEIKAEIEALDGQTGSTLTTGPVAADALAQSLVILLLNDSGSVQAPTVTVFDLTVSPKQAFVVLGPTTLQPGQSTSFITMDPPTLYEVVFQGMSPGVFGWTSSRKNHYSDPVVASFFLSSNTFRHSELVPIA